MKITDKIAARKSSQPFYNIEFFPPKTDQGFQNLLPRIGRLSKLDPLAISITWGAGGSTKERSLDLAGLTQSEYGLETILHLTCTNMMQGMVDMALRAAKDRGIQNILALRGDPPRGKEAWIPIDPKFQHAVDLVSYIRSTPEFADFCVGVAAYPDGHPDLGSSADDELIRLKEKVDAGADFIVTQLFYDADNFLVWLQKVRDMGITVPVIPGVMPIQTYSSFIRLTKLCGVRVPDSVLAALEPIKNDDQRVKEYGVNLTVDMLKRITADGKVPGVHFCTLNLERSIQRVLETLNWHGVVLPPHNKLIQDSPNTRTVGLPEGESDYVVDPSEAASDANLGLAHLPKTENEAGSGELNNAASWDDFPNGRFGDFKSPAFGEQGLWGQSLVRSETLADWGQPKTLEDLTRVFLDHLHSKISTTPFSPTTLSPESLMILDQLEALTKRGWWTVGSQPAVNGKSSEDEVLGWGPRAGYVFQKGFVEFFCEEKDVDKIEDVIQRSGQGWVHYFAANAEGDCRTNVPEDGRNAVTWGVFPGQEIVQTTIIERESFLSWKEEAFSIWADWASYYRPGSEERTLLESVKKERWLVSVVHHDYQNPDALWTLLSQV